MSRKMPLRDPAAPKRNMSAYLLYQNAMRESFKEQNPGMSFGQLSKYTSAMYAELSPEEKEVWVQHAEVDKQRYLHELSTYVPSSGYDAKGDAIAGLFLRTGTGGKGAKGLQKDPKAPKKNLSAYLIYQNTMRDTFKAEHPAMTFGQLSKHTSEKYRNLTQEERKEWDDKAAADKERYEREIEAYNPPEGYDKTGVMIASREPGPRKYTKKEKDPNAPKRARGSYVFFTCEVRPKILKEFPGIKFTDLGNIMGERWRALAPEAKKRFEDMAQEDKKRFQDEMDEFNASKPEIIAPVSPHQHRTDYSYASPHRTPYTHPVAEHDSHHYQQYYDANAAAAAAVHQQYIDYYAQGYHPAASQAYAAYAQQHPGHAGYHEEGQHENTTYL